jgi:hypothetical protein
LNPSALVLSTPSSLSSTPQREPRRANQRKRWRCRGPPGRRARPMGGCAAVERLLGGVLHRMRTRNGVPKSIDDHSFPHDGDVSQPAVASPSTRAAPWEAAASMAGPEPTAASGGSRSTHVVSGSIHSQRWWPRGQHNKVSPETLTHSSSSPSLFFYPNLDRCASLTLVPLMDMILRLGARTSGLHTLTRLIMNPKHLNEEP